MQLRFTELQMNMVLALQRFDTSVSSWYYVYFEPQLIAAADEFEP